MPLRSLFVDFNAYFASVEQQTRPELRNRPVVVVPVMAETTCCIATSHEARRFGVKTGTVVADARRFCPGLHVVHARPALYVEFHQRLVEAVESCMHVNHVFSIDEMSVGLIGRFQKRDLAEGLARQIKKTIATRVGAHLHSSIGIAPNRFLAKTASDMQKPDGLVVIEEEDLPRCLHRLSLRDFCGIGERMEARLRQRGIGTVEALCAARRETLRHAWGGVEGERMHALLRGEDLSEKTATRRTIGHSHVLPPGMRNENGAFAVLNRLIQKAAMRLRKMRYFAGELQVFVKYREGGFWEREIRFFESQDTLEFIRAISRMWKLRSFTIRTPLMVGVTLRQLVSEASHTPSLFGWDASRHALHRAVDTLNERFGRNTVYFGGAHAALSAAPMRIAFTRIPDVQTEGD